MFFFVKPDPVAPVQPLVNDNNVIDNKINENDITKNWKVYRNEEFGFEIKYPRDWEYKIQDGGGMGIDDGIIFTNSKNQDNFIFFDLSPSGYYMGDVNKYAQEDFKIREFKIEAKENIVVDGIDGVKYTSSYDNPINKKYVAAYWPDKSTVREDDFFILETYIKPENKDRGIEIINIFDQMLSTFKFINP
jgi:hypothetical protein